MFKITSVRPSVRYTLQFLVLWAIQLLQISKKEINCPCPALFFQVPFIGHWPVMRALILFLSSTGRWQSSLALCESICFCLFLFVICIISFRSAEMNVTFFFLLLIATKFLFSNDVLVLKLCSSVSFCCVLPLKIRKINYFLFPR